MSVSSPTPLPAESTRPTSPSSDAFVANPLHTLREGRLPRRFIQLYLGLVLFGFSLALMIRAQVGLAPWDVLHEGIVRHTPLTFGTVVILMSFVVLLAWIPLRQWPGIGTVSNAIVVGLVTDLGLWLIAPPSSMPVRIGFMVVGLVLNGFATAAYIGTRLGPGPRDGLMTGLVRRTSRSVRLVRTVIEVAVLGAGWLLGGTIGVGTVLFAFGIGPLTQLFLPRLTIRPLAARPDRP